MDAQKKIREHISALGDGELASSDLELAAAALGTPDGELAWISYHRIGDVLRAQAAPEFSPGFDASLRERLAAEAPPLRRAPAGASGASADAPVPTTGNSTSAVAASVGGSAAPGAKAVTLP
jgi:sigma-E factor negative regulatory protein RseA